MSQLLHNFHKTYDDFELDQNKADLYDNDVFVVPANETHFRICSDCRKNKENLRELLWKMPKTTEKHWFLFIKLL